MHRLGDFIGLAAIGLLLLTGCEPGDPVAKNGLTPGELESCCEEPTPSLTDARKQAMLKDGPSKSTTEPKKDEPTSPSMLDTKKPAGPIELQPLPTPDKRNALELDFTFTDQDEKPFDLKSIKGKVAVATFIFTSCPNPNMCPLQGVKIATMQSRLEKAGLSDKVNLLVFTFDPGTDTPAVLRKWGQTQGIAYTNAKMLRPDPREFLGFQDAFGFRAGPTPDGKVNHQTDLLLIDHEGRLAAFYGGLEIWDDAKMLEKVKELIGEIK